MNECCENIRERLFALKDDKYAEFQLKLTPTITRDEIMGVRNPLCRQLAKELYKQNEYNDFLDALPHKFYDENMLHGLIISNIKDYDECIKRIDEFLPYINNWAVCDSMSPKILEKNKDKLIEKINEWVTGEWEYTVRFGVDMLMSHFLDEDFKREYLEIPVTIKREEYYIKMMIAWYYATALVKQWDSTIPYLENKVLDVWIHNKSIQKAIESYRVSDGHKEYLRTLKIRLFNKSQRNTDCSVDSKQ